MSDHKPNFFIRLWRFFWGIVNGIRLLVINLIFLFFLVIIILAIKESAPKPITRDGPLFVAPSGVLVDQYSYQPPLAALTGEGPAETRLYDLIKTINHAAYDKRVTGMVLKVSDLAGGGTSKIAELGQAIEKFKDQGKPVIAYGEMLSQQQYLLASYADHIHIHDMGGVALTGVGLFRNYFEEVIQKLGINVNVFKSGTFKDFVEPYTRRDMSEESRKHNSAWLLSLWKQYSGHIEKHRDLEKGAINRYIENLPSLAQAHNGNAAKLALEYNLVDSIGTRQDLLNRLIGMFGADSENANMFNYIDLIAYQQRLFFNDLQNSGNIGLIIASGTILDGEQPDGTIGGDSLSRLIRSAREDDTIQAIVLRIDSGGGSAFASELIRQEILAARNAGKPVVVSMGSMAASGGYWISSAADEIWAQPTTLTGSIGVFSIVPTFEKSLEKIGINNDGIATSKLASLFQLERPMTDEAKTVFQMSVDAIYAKFLELSAEGRNTTVDEIAKIAEGRVWIGTQAKKLNLVDNLGSLDEAINSAAELAQIERPQVKTIERELSPLEQVMRSLMMQADAAGLLTSFKPEHAQQSPLTQTMSYIENVSDHPIFRALVESSSSTTPPKVLALCPDCSDEL